MEKTLGAFREQFKICILLSNFGRDGVGKHASAVCKCANLILVLQSIVSMHQQ